MHISERLKEKELFNILSSIKLGSLLFSTILFLNQLAKKESLSASLTLGMNFGMIPVLVLILLLVYFLWYIFSIRAYNSKHYRKLQIIENFVFIIIFTFLNFLSENHTYESQYKLLYIFIIIISTLQLGMKFGITVAAISSILILVIDLISAPKLQVNSYFEKDLILVGVFLSTAASLGHYVKFEKEKLHWKNIHLQELSKEIQEKERERIYIEEILFNNETCYNLLFQNSGDAILVHRDNNIIFANERASKLLNFSSIDDLTKKSILELPPDEEIAFFQDKLSVLEKSDTNMITFEIKIKKSNGEFITVEVTSTKFTYKGKLTILSIFHDITSDKEVKKLQKDVEKNLELLNETREFNRLITEFFSNISHELKTPLNVIYTAVQVLSLPNFNSQEVSFEKQSKYLKIMKQNCFRLMRLINNLLDLTRADSGFLKLNLENHNLVNIVEDISQSVVPYLESKNISFIFDTDTEEIIMAFDPDKIERIILNLLSNAFKFTNPYGEISVYISVQDDKVAIIVKDTGIGIPEDKLGIIFERFGQVDRTLRRFHEGSGIGLSLVKSFVEMQGGTIDIKSEVDVGSEFIIILPVKKIEEDKTTDIPVYENNIERIHIEFSDIYSEL